MTVRTGGDGSIELLGACPGADAEPLLQLLLAAPGAAVDWRGCRGAHTAVIQVLLAARPKLVGPPADDHLREWVAPLIAPPADAGVACVEQFR